MTGPPVEGFTETFGIQFLLCRTQCIIDGTGVSLVCVDGT